MLAFFDYNIRNKVNVLIKYINNVKINKYIFDLNHREPRGREHIGAVLLILGCKYPGSNPGGLLMLTAFQM